MYASKHRHRGAYLVGEVTEQSAAGGLDSSSPAAIRLNATASASKSSPRRGEGTRMS